VLNAYLRKDQAISILQAAAAADCRALESLRAQHRNTANSLTPVLQSLADGNQKLTEIARLGVSSMEEGVSILFSNLAFTKQIRGIMDHVTSVATAVEEMAATATEISTNAHEAARCAAESKAKSVTGNESVSSLIGDIDLLEKAVTSVAQSMKQFVSFSQDINKLTAIVRDIAHQTNLLALNAAIEAARAGEAGRGFAVVADEVKKLADKTAQATGEIESVTGTMNALTAKVNDSVDDSLERLGKSVTALETVATVMGDGSRIVMDVNDRVHQIAAAAEEQSTVAGEMARNLSDVTNALQCEAMSIEAVNDHARALTGSAMTQLNLLAKSPHEGLLLQAVKSDHLMWKLKLAGVLESGITLSEAELKDHTQCRLGKWYLGPGKERFGHLTAFRDIEAPHARVHMLGREIVQLAATNALDQAVAARLFELIDQLTQAMQTDESH
jgi:methyl-accepting chemotaxis protein